MPPGFLCHQWFLLFIFCLHYCSHNLPQGHGFKSHVHVNQSQRCMSSQTFSECQTQSMSSCGLGISLWLSSWHLKLNLCHPTSSSSPKPTPPQLHQRKWWQLPPSYCSGQSPQSTSWWLSFPLIFNASESPIVSIESSTQNETASYQAHGFHLVQATTISPQDNASVMSQFLPAALATFSLFSSHQPMYI